MSSPYAIPSDFEVLPDDDLLLERIASTDIVGDSDWSRLRNVIKYKLDKNISLFLSQAPSSPPRPPNPTFVSHTTPSGGLKLPPFPPRRQNQQLNAIETPISYMNEQQAHENRDFIFEQLHEFESNPPFTIQRVCELILHPMQNYNSVGKYLRAVEKTLLVTSTWDAFPPLTSQETDPAARSTLSIGTTSLTAPATPLFSPIPFLHDDARRSKSRSPPPASFSPLALNPANAATSGELDPLETKGLGLVDELDDPSPGHMSDHPTALSSVTTVNDGPGQPFLGSLEQRFVPSETGEGKLSDASSNGNGMVLDDAEGAQNKS